ncbi:hypothetical protein HELRODRAFT_163238 [Helobdella robusta]|uniref:Uncharacterized protein n=1 Tax=Helobdella robusta TaxID=6412 RepID=T1ETT7_HELRO|nr:hypothetical protein HELRODRAFT_163238 [Helobdella robusta]ESN96197.1 hypothetical protein HELRODRAFT_163238 [Helobdella robusta]
MLKSMFPVSELVKLLDARGQDNVALLDLNKHDDLVSVLCINKKRYLKTADNLSDYLAELHTLSVLPNIVIIQNLTHYTSQFEPEKFHSKTAKLLALIKDTAKYLTTKVETIDEAKFVLSVNTFDSEDLLTLLKKNFKNIWHTQEHTNANECTITLARMGSVLNSRLLFEEDTHNIKALKIS